MGTPVETFVTCESFRSWTCSALPSAHDWQTSACRAPRIEYHHLNLLYPVSTNLIRARLSSIEAFCQSYELGSFTVAARSLGVTPQAVSRSVAKLEKSLGVPLFRRNTRHIEATEAGRSYYEACRAALQTLDDAEARLRGTRDDLAGEVRVSVPTTYGHHRFLPMLASFRRRYPRIEIDVEVANQNIDFVRDGFDLAIRMGELQDASFVVRRLGDFSLGVFASPSYIEERGRPMAPSELDLHECAVFVMPRTGRPLPWTFAPGPESLTPKAAARIRGDALGLITFARAGGGLTQIYHYLVERELERGQLIEVLQEYSGRSRPFSLIYPKEAVTRPAVRVLVDFIVEQSRADR
jgi:DNA-binding transcriptional LysR family regulator